MNSCNINLTCKDICEIITLCGISGVEEFTYSNLHIKFAGKRLIDKEITTHSPGQVWQDSAEDKKILAQEEYNLMEDQLAELQLINPLKYEELLAQREF